MSQENLEVVRTLLLDGADLARLYRDEVTWTSWKANVEAVCEPDYTVAWIAHGQSPIEATGVDDARQGWLDWLEPWETHHVHVERIIQAGDRVVVLVRLHGRMAATQSEVETFSASVLLLRDGRVARVEHYANRAEALEATGLQE